ncbi:hypothetical protein HG433_001870 [Candidatus Saccharibacteria bacterium]|nr:hypothetical protein [Candidatus Saccharibacteria bacterium]
MNGEKSIPSGWESHIYSVTGEKTEFIIPKKGVYIEVPKQSQERLLSLDRRGEISFVEEAKSEIFDKEEYREFGESFLQALRSTSRIISYATGQPYHEMGLKSCAPLGMSASRGLLRLAHRYEKLKEREDDPRVVVTPYNLSRKLWEQAFRRAMEDDSIENNPLRQQIDTTHDMKRTIYGLHVRRSLSHDVWPKFNTVPKDTAVFYSPDGIPCTASVIAGRQEPRFRGMSYQKIHKLDWWADIEEPELSVEQALSQVAAALIGRSGQQSSEESKRRGVELSVSIPGLFSVGGIPVPSLRKPEQNPDQMHAKSLDTVATEGQNQSPLDKDPNLYKRYGYDSQTIAEALTAELSRIIEGESQAPGYQVYGAYCKTPEQSLYAPYVVWGNNGCVTLSLQDINKGNGRIGFRHATRCLSESPRG